MSQGLAGRPLDTLRVRWARELTGDDGRDYDAFVQRAASGHFAQARAWAPLARAGRPFASSYLLARGRDGGVVGAAHVLRARVAGLPLPYAVVERGPVVDDPSLFHPVLEALAREARRHGILRLALTPYWEASASAPVQQALAALGWRCVQTVDGAHAATLRLPCAEKTDEQLFAGGDHAKLRQQIRYAERAGACTRRGSAADVPIFAGLYRALMGGQGLHTKPEPWFRALGAHGLGPDGPGQLFLTAHQGETIAAALAVRHGRLVTLYMCASGGAPRKFSRTVLALVAIARWARDQGCDFDLGGIPMDGDTDGKRLAIAQFKREFARTPVRLLQQHARWLL
jgi:lipid II:glycine glycyltransferase (peptidoglycan interpeptide bridge formation enzyme)